MEVKGVVKKKRRVRRSEEEPTLKRRREVRAEETSVAKEAERGGVEETPRRVVVPEVVDIASEGMEVVPVVVEIATGVARAIPGVQVKGGATGPEPRRGEQPQGGPTPQGRGVSLTTAIYHARAVAGQLEGEEGPTKVGANRLVGIVEEAALRSTARFNEAELLRGLYSAQIEVTTLARALLRKAGAIKLKADEAKTQLAKLKKKSKELEGERAKAVEEKESLQKELEAGRAKAAAEKESLQKEFEAEKARATAKKESLQEELEVEKAKETAERATLDKELAEERAKAASERAAYLDLYVAAVDQFKGSAEF
ncbi:dynactin subunit 1-like [Camellia sinensis]|uniref:dynactin subunit 1-like n=1 Tax=Camellia sinensis TaxID=4442 RepID=UPI001035E6B5|nr:dynactin subunit 1-like [Camellia sinensis]